MEDRRNTRYGINGRHFLLLILVSCIIPVVVQAQKSDTLSYSFDFRGAELAHVLETVAKEAAVDMVYDPKLVEGIHIYKRIRNRPVHNVLREVLNETPLDFVTLSSGTIVIVLAVNDSPAYGSYAGKVVDRQTGHPLPGASVMLADASGGTSTGSSGSFTLNKLVTGSYTIIFSYVGYEPVYKTVDIKPNQEVTEKISLKPKPVDFSPIVVTGHVPQLPYRGSGGQSIDSRSPWNPGDRMQDAIRSLTLFQGVQYGLPMTDLHLQGGQRGEHRILLDGVPVYNPYSFGQMFSAFSPFAISKVQLYKAGYGVPEGSQIAGVIDLKHDIGNVDRNRAMFQADPLSLNIRGDLYFPGSGNDESSLKIMTAARSNYWDLYQEPNLNRTLREWDDLDPLITDLLIDSDSTTATLYEPREHNAEVRFQDLHLAGRYQIDAYKTLSSSFYLGENFVSTNLIRQAGDVNASPQYLYARDSYRWKNLMARLTYDHLVSSRLDLSSQASFSSNRLRHRYLIGTNNNPVIPATTGFGASLDYVSDAFSSAEANNQIPTQSNNNRIEHFIVRTDGNYSFSPNFSLEAGAQIDFVQSRVDLNDLFFLPTLADQQSLFISSYLNGSWRAGRYWKITAGNRLTVENQNRRIYTEPRVALQYDRPGTAIGYWSVRLSGGLYRQFINQFEITNPGPTSLVPSFTVWSHAGASEKPKAWHASASIRMEPSEQTGLNLEGFYKWQPTTYTVSHKNLLEGTTVQRSGFNAFAETTSLKALGASLRLNQSFADSKVKLVFGYDYNFTRINLDTQFGRAVPVPWEEPHRFQFRALWRIMPQLSAVAKWQSILGRSWGFRQAYYNFLLYETGTQYGNFHIGSPEDDYLSPFHQLDFSLIYQPTLAGADLETRLNLINLLDRRNTIDWSLMPLQPADATSQEYEIRERTMPGFNPSISIKVNF